MKQLFSILPIMIAVNSLTAVTSGQQEQSATNAPVLVASSKSKAEVSVLFATRKVLSVDELRADAKKALKKKGHEISDQLHCAINIVINGKDSDCSIIFQDHTKQMIYVVVFNAQGDITEVFAGKEHEGVPPKGSPPPKVPPALRGRP